MATQSINTVIYQLRRAALFSEVANLTDGELVESFLAQRSEAAFEALVHRHGAMVFDVCRRMIGDLLDAEDAFQATFLVLARKAASVAPREGVGNWLYGVAFRTAQRARAVRARRASHEKSGKDMHHLSAEPADRVQELEGLLDEELNRLPDKYRLPLILCDLENRPRKEAARQLKLPEGTLSSRLAAARKLLAKRLARHGAPLSAGALATMMSQSAAAASVPNGLATSTSKAASLYAAGQAATGLVSASALALTEGVVKTMFLAKLAKMSAVLLLLALSCVGVGFLAGSKDADGAVHGAQRGEKASTPSSAIKIKNKTDKELIQGTWKVLKADHNGKVQPNENATGDDQIWRITEGRISVRYADGAAKEIGYRLDSSAKPKAVDVTIPDEGGSKYLGIYTLDGDTLQFAYSRNVAPTATRPTDFFSTEFAESRGRRYFLLMRQETDKRKGAGKGAKFDLQGVWETVRSTFNGKGRNEEKAVELEFKTTEQIIIRSPRNMEIPIIYEWKPGILTIAGQGLWIYAPIPGTVKEIPAGLKSGGKVAKGQPLVVMFDSELKKQVNELQTDIEILGKKLNAPAPKIPDPAKDKGADPVALEEAKITHLKKIDMLKRLKDRTNADLARPGHFTIDAPNAGIILSADFRENLLRRNVRPSDPLICIQVGNIEFPKVPALKESKTALDALNCIYKLDRDTLTICAGSPERKPRDFTDKDQVLWVLKRQPGAPKK